MNILLLYPRYPDTFWSFKHALKFISKKASFPPLGLLTVAAMLPEKWNKKLIDMNVASLTEEDIEQADLVFISAMVVQKQSVKEIMKMCTKLNKKIVAGGPLFTTGYKEFETTSSTKGIDYFVLGEAEVTLPLFLRDFEKGEPKHLYQTDVKPGLEKTAVPLWRLVEKDKYASMNIQYSRGCPFNCEFCDITLLYGRIQRTKSKEQIITELNALYDWGWRDGVFFVDDNFIGNKEKLKKEILPAITKWMKIKKYPFTFSTEASVNLADDNELMEAMIKAGFNGVFLGIETPDEESLTECGKFQNKNRDLIEVVKKIQRYGMEVQAGFIVGFDEDKLSIFERQIKFIQKSGIVTAMVGILNVLRDTKLYCRLKREGRLLKEASGDNTDFSMNFVPRMNPKVLMDGYRKIVKTIYSPKYYYARVTTFLKEYKPFKRKKFQIRFHFYHIKAFLKSVWFLGVIGKERIYYWKLILWSLFTRPRVFPMAVTFAIYGYHFRKVFEKY